MIKLEQICKSYDPLSESPQVLDRFSLDIAAGECVALLGRSGCGKSTTMNIIGLLDGYDSGKYSLDGKDCSQLSATDKAYLRNKFFGFIFQNFYLLSRLTVLENVVLPLWYAGIPQEQHLTLAQDILKEVEMDAFSKQYPRFLSGGQQQRVAIARALVNRPKVILADEPTGALDAKTGQHILDLFFRLRDQYSVTLLIVTHDPMVAKLCSRQVYMDDGEVRPLKEQ
jgi:putative ABC transport system ATP-binding protein